jgi:HSP20 family protein
MNTNKLTKVEPAPLKPSVFGSTFGFPMFQLLSRELDDIFGRFEVGRSAFEPVWAPNVEMLTKNNEFIVRADVPGLKKEDITVELTEESVVLRGERKHEKEEKSEGYYHTERTYGSFYRSLPLPEGVKIEGAKAIVHDGVIEITIPVAKVESKRRKLEITEPTPGKTIKAA